MYYLSVTEDEYDLIRRMPFRDYSDAVSHLSRYARPRGSGRCVLEFLTEVINGEFARSYAELAKPDDVPMGAFFEERYAAAVKKSNAYVYSHHYTFLIESEAGIRDADIVSQLFDDAESRSES